MPVQTGVSCKWTNDSQRLLLEHFDIIRDSPSQVYYSALPQCPSSSWLHKFYTAESLQVAKVVKGPAEWGMCFRTVALVSIPLTLVCWNNTIAVGFYSGRIRFINAITGNQLAVLSKHTDWVISLAFSSDGTFLVSGSDDRTVILWDVQTGGVVKSFCGHTGHVNSVSISMDYTTIASGSSDHTIRLWDIQTGGCNCIINRQDIVTSVSFFPTNSQFLISASQNGTIEQWDIKGCQIGSTYEGYYTAFSSDGSCFISWRGSVATVWNSDSLVVVAELQVARKDLECCCLSPSAKFVAGSVGCTIYVWDITGTNPYLIKTLLGHSDTITSITFSFSLTSTSRDKSVRFWQIGTPPTDPVATDITSTPPTLTKIQSVSLQTKDGAVITSDKAGQVKTWDVTTGLCKETFQTPANGFWRDAQLIEGRLVLVWWEVGKIHILDARKEKLIKTVTTSLSEVHGLRISGDGSKVFCLSGSSILAWSIWTGDIVGNVGLGGKLYLDPLFADGSRIWVSFWDSSVQEWDFGTPSSSPIPLSTTSLSRPRLDLIDGHKWWWTSLCKVKDTITGEEVFHMSGKYGKPTNVQWDGQYLVAGYESGEVLILDFNQLLPH